MSRISRFAVRFFMVALTLFAVIAVGVNRYRSQAQIGGIPIVTVVSAATFEDGPLAPDSIAVIFGQGLSSGTASATTTPLPVTLLGTSVQLTDSRNVKHACGLFFVSPGQVNFLIPAAAAPGVATVAIMGGIFPITANIQIAAVAPGLFSANSSGQGAATGFLLAVPQSGGQSYEPLAEFNPVLKRFQARPVLILRQTVQAERLFFVFYGTGIRGRANLNNVTAVMGGLTVPVSYAGPAGNLLGLDQINIEVDDFLKRTLTGRGRISVALNVVTPGGAASISNQIEIDLAGQGGSPTLQISNFTPQRALAGETLTINGSGFTSSVTGNRVRIGGLTAQVTEATETQLKVRVPFGVETGRITVGTGNSETTSRESLAIRTSVSGFVEDTRRRPVIGVRVSIISSGFGGIGLPSTLPTTKTNSEGVFVLPDVPTDGAVYLEIDASAASVTPRLPKLLLSPVIAAGRDTALPRPVTLQIPTGTAIRVPITNITAPSSLQGGSPETYSLYIPSFQPSFDLDWPVGSQTPAVVGTETEAQAQQVCTPPIRPGPITLTLPDRVTVFAPCYTTEECSDLGILLYASQIENSRSPVRLPVGHYSSMMVQISPFESFITPGGELIFPNSDCLPTNSTARIFQLTGSGLRIGGGLGGGISTPLGQFADRGPAAISADGQRVTMGNDIVDGGGIYFVSVKRPTATIIGRIQDTVFITSDGSVTNVVPASGAIVTARGQEAVTDNNGAFILRNVPVLRTGDRVSLEVSLLRPNGRVERGLMTDIAITGGSVTSLNPFTLVTPETNRPPVILASAAVSADENKRRDFNFSVSDADPNQTLQVRMTGPSFASLINRGGGAYTLRITPGFEDSGNYTVTLTAVDSLGAIATHSVALTVNNVNQPPTATAQTVAAEEDTSKKITLTGADGDRDALAFTVVAQPLRGKLTGDAPDLTYTPDANYFGADSFTFKVNDGLADSATATVLVSVVAVNDQPRLAVPAEQKVAAGATLNFAVSATEFDLSDTVTLSATDLPTGATFNQLATGFGFAAQFSWTPTASQTGVFIVGFKAVDSGSPALSETRSVAITVTAAGAPASAGTWTPTSGPTGGSVQTLFASGSTVLASTTNGVFRSTDGGDTWSPVGNSALGSFRLSFASIGNTIFAATYFSGVYRSSDNGATWVESSQGLPQFPSIGGFVAKGSSLFAEINSVIYVSVDNGQNWSRAGTVPRENLSSVSMLAAGGQSLFAAVNSFGSSRKLYRSTDDGQTWTLVGNGLPEGPFNQITQIVANGNTLYAALDDAGLYRSLNDGQNWVSVPLSLGIVSIRAIHFTPDQLLLGTTDRLYAVARTGDLLETTVRVALDNQDISALASSGDSVFAGTQANGVFRSTDKAQTWKQANAGLTGIAVATFLPVDTSLFAATDLGIFVTEDQGKTWQAMNNGLPPIVSFGGFVSFFPYTTLASVNAAGATHLFTGQESGGLYRSSDLAKSWQTVTTLPNGADPIALGVNGSTIFASISSRLVINQMPIGEVYRSDDLGQTWTPAGNGLSLIPTAFASIGSNLFAATQEGVFVTLNKGDSWSRASGQGATGVPEKTTISALATRGSNLYAGTVERGIYVSANNGQSWTAINTYLPEKPTVTAIAASGANLFIVASGIINGLCQSGFPPINGSCEFGRLQTGLLPRSYVFVQGTVYFSPNQGRSWAPVTSGLDDTRATALGLNGTNVFAGTIGRGVFSRQF